MNPEYGKELLLAIEFSDPGTSLFRVRTRPFSADDALAMAGFARDYKPVHLFAAADPGVETRQPLLHPFWITGLVDRAMRILWPGCRVTRLAVVHCSSAVIGEALTLKATLLRWLEPERRLDLEIVVSTSRYRVVATGTVRVFVDR